jgi:hypothetical protein
VAAEAWPAITACTRYTATPQRNRPAQLTQLTQLTRDSVRHRERDAPRGTAAQTMHHACRDSWGWTEGIAEARAALAGS